DRPRLLPGHFLGCFRLSLTDGDLSSEPNLDPDGSNREAARWVLAHGGSVGVVGRDGTEESISGVDKIPNTQFLVRAANWEKPVAAATGSDPGARPGSKDTLRLSLSNVDGQSLQVLDLFPAVESLSVSRGELSDGSLQALRSTRSLKTLDLVASRGYTSS